MRIIINFDLEGVTGVVLETEQTGRTKLFYEQSRALSTGDINAVARGAVKAGADEVYLIDSHAGWGQNLIFEDLEEEVRYLNGRSASRPLSVMSEVSSHMAMFVLRGPGVKKGYVRPPDKLGYVRMIDIVPTICHILGIEPPVQSRGAVAYDLFEGHEMVRELPGDRVEDRELDERVILQRGMHDYAVIEDDDISTMHYAEILRKVGRGGYRRRAREK